MCELLGDGKQRDQVETLGYLFYVSDKNKAKELNYLDESDSSDPWFKLRRQEMLTPERIVEQAQVLHEKYGFRNFKLKGGVLKGSEEMEAIRALKKHSRTDVSTLTRTAHGAWQRPLSCASRWKAFLHIEDPCGPESGFSSREIMAEFKNKGKPAGGYQHDCNRLETVLSCSSTEVCGHRACRSALLGIRRKRPHGSDLK